MDGCALLVRSPRPAQRTLFVVHGSEGSLLELVLTRSVPLSNIDVRADEQLGSERVTPSRLVVKLKQRVEVRCVRCIFGEIYQASQTTIS